MRHSHYSTCVMDYTHWQNYIDNRNIQYHIYMNYEMIIFHSGNAYRILGSYYTNVFYKSYAARIIFRIISSALSIYKKKFPCGKKRATSGMVRACNNSSHFNNRKCFIFTHYTIKSLMILDGKC